MDSQLGESRPEEMLLLEEWKERARTNQIVHYEEEERLKRTHLWLGLPAIALSALVGTMMFVLLKLVGEDWIKMLFGVFGFIAAFLTTFQTFLKLSERAAEHKQAAVQYGQIFREIEKQIALYDPDRNNAHDTLTQIEKRLGEAAVVSPTVPRRLWKQIKSPDSKIAKV